MNDMRSQAARQTRSTYPEVLVVDGLVLHVTRKAIKNMYLRIKPPQGDIVVSAPLRMTDGQIERFEVLVVDGLVLHVTRKAIKNMYLRIKPPQGDIVVSAPLRMTDGQIERFARERRSWILAQQQRIREARQRLADTAADGASRGGEPAGWRSSSAYGRPGNVWRTRPRTVRRAAGSRPVSSTMPHRGGRRSAGSAPRRRSTRGCRHWWSTGPQSSANVRRISHCVR